MTVRPIMTQPPLPPVSQPVPSAAPTRVHTVSRPSPPAPFDAEVELQLAACRRHGVKAGVIFLRLRNLDALGATPGSELLKPLADVVHQRLHSRLRRVDRLARVDADTFGVALFDARADVLPTIEARLRGELERPVRLGDQLLTLEVESGTSIGHRIGTTAADLIRRAEGASGR